MVCVSLLVSVAALLSGDRHCGKAKERPRATAAPTTQPERLRARLVRAYRDADAAGRLRLLRDLGRGRPAMKAEKALKTLRAFAQERDPRMSYHILSTLEEYHRRVDTVDDTVETILLLAKDEPGVVALFMEDAFKPYVALPGHLSSGRGPEGAADYARRLAQWWKVNKAKYASPGASGQNHLRLLWKNHADDADAWAQVFDTPFARDPEFRRRAAWAIMKLGLRDCGDALLKQLRRERDPAVQVGLLTSLTDLGAERYRPVFYEYLLSDNDRVRVRSALTVTKELGDKVGLVVLVSAMATADDPTYIWAAQIFCWGTGDAADIIDLPGGLLTAKPEVLRRSRTWLARAWPHLSFDKVTATFKVARPATTTKPRASVHNDAE